MRTNNSNVAIMKSLPLLCFSIIVLFSCTHKKHSIFTSLPASYTGINFINIIKEEKFTKSTMNEFGYMGGGIGIGDFNNDGRKDIFFCGNQVSSQLYLNVGDNKFENITTKAGLQTSIWITGVSVIDINNDGYDDLFLNAYGYMLDKPIRNLLYINQRNNTFVEEGILYGFTDSTHYSTQSAFLDYDNDGDLDMFQLNYNLNASYNANNVFPKDLSGKSKANDLLYRNDGVKYNLRHPVYTNVTMEAGIKDDGYGLGVSVSDFNNDGWTDIYVSNDFVSNDALWLNNKNGTFTNTLDKSTKHQSFSSMGCDAADINNDAKIDFATLDMMPQTNERKKLTDISTNYDRYEAERSLHYSPEFTRNMLQLNNGNYFAHDTAIPFFSEIGQLAGISETEWSWSILFADFTNDGFKDAHITNGIGKDFINADFILFNNIISANTNDPVKARNLSNIELGKLKELNLPNYFFLHNGILPNGETSNTFTNQSDSAGIAEKSMSNGAAYVDLDNDGDLDLVVNNINKAPFIFINNTIEKIKPLINHSIGFNLEGDSLNKRGFGAKIYLFTNGQIQLQEQAPIRGFLSSVDTKLLFGTGKNTLVDSVVIIWPNQKTQILTKLSTDSVYTLKSSEAVNISWELEKKSTPLFTDVTNSLNSNFKHTDVSFFDYGFQRMLPQKYSQLGPFLSTTDVNKDGLEDFYIGGAFNQYGQLFMQKDNGSFTSKTLDSGIKLQEDEATTFFDADGDSDVDLLITYGDMRYEDSSTNYKPRLYVNDGKGNFVYKSNAIPNSVTTIAGCVTTGDYDNDGDADIFIGGRVSKTYPISPRSYLLQNNNGTFKDVTNIVNSNLQLLGMVTGASWVDFDNDKKLDLVVVGEWMPIQFFKNKNGSLIDVTAQTNLSNTNGMWRSLYSTDLDNDGDVDFVAGNLGTNCKYNASISTPMKLFAKDIDQNGSIDPFLFYYMPTENGKIELFPANGRSSIVEQVPSIKKSFLTNTSFTKANFNSIYKDKSDLLDFTCYQTASSWFENLGNGKFTQHILPEQAQFSPTNAIVVTDVNNDHINDIIIAGNEYQAEVNIGRYDASYGLVLTGNKNKTFTALPYQKSGLKIDGDVKSMQIIYNSKKQKLLLVGINNDYLKIFAMP